MMAIERLTEEVKAENEIEILSYYMLTEEEVIEEENLYNRKEAF